MTKRIRALDDERAGIVHGSLETFKDQLQAWIERGEVIPPPEG